jgi:hypothetical protein
MKLIQLEKDRELAEIENQKNNMAGFNNIDRYKQE